MRRAIPLTLLTLLASLLIITTPVQAACVDAAAPAVDWSGCDKSGLSLIGVDLTDANLIGVDFSDTDLSSANLSAADLTSSSLGDTTLIAANLTDTNLFDASIFRSDFTNAVIAGMDLSNATVTETDFTGATGTPVLNVNTLFSSNTCPDGAPSGATGCGWLPTAVTLSNVDAAAPATLWPLLAAALLILSITLVMSRNRCPSPAAELS